MSQKYSKTAPTSPRAFPVFSPATIDEKFEDLPLICELCFEEASLVERCGVLVCTACEKKYGSELSKLNDELNQAHKNVL